MSGATAYDVGRLTTVASAALGGALAVTENLNYDPLGRPCFSQEQVGSNGPYTFGYQYNLASGMTTETYPSGRAVASTFDAQNRPNAVSAGATTYARSVTYASSDAVAQIQYGSSGAPVGTEAVTFDHGLATLREQPTSITVTKGSSTPLTLNYWYCTSQATSCNNNNGNVQTAGIVAPSLNLTQTFGYDKAKRLTSAAETGGTGEWSQGYGYDAYGNRWVSSGTTLYSFTPTAQSDFNSTNQLTQAGATYDSAGNQKTIGGYGFTYDAENRQTFATLAGATFTYGYDGAGSRVSKGNDGETTIYVYDAMGQLAAEYATVAPGPSGTHYVIQDALGSTRLVLDGSGNTLAYDDYMPFGEQVPIGSGGRGDLYEAADGTTQKFTGKERDDELASSAMEGLDYFGARYYSGGQGRFTSPDPENASAFLYPDDPQSWNGYAYGRNNPLRYVDPDGMNYTVCDTQNHCRDVTDEEYNKWRDAQGKNIIVTAGGNILDRETETKIGSAQYYDPSGLEALKAAGNRADVLIKDAAKTMAVNAAMTATGVIALRGLGYVAETAQELGIFKNTKVLVNFAHNLMNIRPGHIPPPGGVAEVQQAVEGAIQTGNYLLKGNGLFEGTTQINGVTVGFRGRFVDGVARVATAFTKR
jgi:RHS repeat-associated protein